MATTARLLEALDTIRVQLEDKMGDIWKLAQLRGMKPGSTLIINKRQFKVVPPGDSDFAKEKSHLRLQATTGKKLEYLLRIPKKPGYYANLMGMSSFNSKHVSIEDIKIGKSAKAHLQKVAGEKAAKKAASKAATHDFKVGEFLYSSWGYDQTNVDFYEVVKVPSGKTIHVQSVGKRVVKNNMSADYVAPVPGHVSGPVLKKRVINHGIKVDHTRATRWNGKPVYQTASGYGH